MSLACLRRWRAEGARDRPAQCPAAIARMRGREHDCGTPPPPAREIVGGASVSLSAIAPLEKRWMNSRSMCLWRPIQGVP